MVNFLKHFFLVWSFHQAYKPNVQRSETLFQFRENYSKAKILCHVCNNVNIFQKLSRKIPWPCMCLHFIKYTKKLSFLNGTIRILIKYYFFLQKSCRFYFYIHYQNYQYLNYNVPNLKIITYSALHGYINRIILFSKGKYNRHQISYMKLFSKKKMAIT